MNRLICIIILSAFSLTGFAQEDLRIRAQMTKSNRLRDSLFQQNIGKFYPDFNATTLNGSVLTEVNLVDKVTIINFWFKYCKPCIAEFDALRSLYNRFADNQTFQFISFTSDDSDLAKESADKYKLPFHICPISSEECRRLNFGQGFPTTIIVDRYGKILYLKSGGGLDNEIINRDISKIEQLIYRELQSK